MKIYAEAMSTGNIIAIQKRQHLFVPSLHARHQSHSTMFILIDARRAGRDSAFSGDQSFS
jgi:hypothetical protein